MFVMWLLGENYLGTSTLGNDVAAMVALFFLLTEAGRTLSIDGYLVKKIPAIRPLLGYGSHLPGNESIAVAKFVMILSYWLVCPVLFMACGACLYLPLYSLITCSPCCKMFWATFR